MKSHGMSVPRGKANQTRDRLVAKSIEVERRIWPTGVALNGLGGSDLPNLIKLEYVESSPGHTTGAKVRGGKKPRPPSRSPSRG